MDENTQKSKNSNEGNSKSTNLPIDEMAS